MANVWCDVTDIKFKDGVTRELNTIGCLGEE